MAEAGISYEVIPGVSSAIAVPAYAGVPVTHRGITAAFTVIAGHTSEPESGIDWAAISKSGTLVFLMGVAHLHEIISQLVAHGMTEDMPVAVIQSGTTAEQIVVVGTLENILEKTRDISPPATIVIGEVVNLRQQIAWFNEPCKPIPFFFSYQEKLA